MELMIQKARDGKEINVVDDQFMCPTYAMDVAVMLKKFLALKPACSIYHMVNGGYCSWYEFAHEIFALLGWDVEVKPIKSNDLKRFARRPISSTLKNNKLEIYNLHMRTWQEALNDYLTDENI